MVQTTTQYMNPDIEAYRLGLLGDTQGLVRNQQIGRQVQGLRGQVNPETGVAYTDTEIAGLLSTDPNPEGVNPGDEGYIEPTNYNPEYISSISQDAVFQPPSFSVAGLDANQTDAIDLASRGVGSYKPYLQEGSSTLNQGIAAAQSGTNYALSGLQDASGLGQTAARQAGTGGAGVLANQAAGLAEAEGMMNAAAGQGQAGLGTATSNARGLSDPLQGSLASSTQGGLTAAQQGQAGANQAAFLARQSTAAAQNQLTDAANFGLGSAQSGIAQLEGASAEFDPSGIGAYSNLYQDQVIDATLADLDRVAARRKRDAGDIAAKQAVSAGAFGSSGYQRALDRSIDPIQEEQDRNTASTIAQLRSQGFESSADRAANAFENARNRQINAATATGQLGQAGAGTSASAAQAGGSLGLGAEQLAQGSALQGAKLGLDASQMEAANAQALASTGLSIEQLASQNADSAAKLGMSAAQFKAANENSLAQTGMGVEQLAAQTGMNAATLAGNMANSAGGLSQGLGSLLAQSGIQQAGLGELEQAMRTNDIGNLLTTGGIQQTNDQAVIDAQRMTDQQSYQLPFQETGFLSDIYAGVPTSSSTVTSGSSNSASPFMQAATLGIGALGAAAGAQRSGLF